MRGHHIIMHTSKIIKFFLIINLIVFIIGYIIGFDKSFWIDEVVSINYALKIPSLSLKEIFTQDIHSPFFYFLLFLGENILGSISEDGNFDLHFLRLINILGFVPIYYSYLLIKKKYTTNLNISVFFLVLISSNYFFHYILDLRMYFLLLSFSLLINVINLINTVENENKITFLVSSILLSMLHVYGLVMSMSILIFRFIKNIYFKDKKKLIVNLTFVILLLIIFIIFYFPSLLNEENKLNIGWIRNNLWYYRIFIEYTIATLVLIFGIIILLSWIYKKELAKKQNISKFFKSDFFYETVVLAVPAIILMSVVLAISFLLFPIVHYRSLIVIFPNLVLYASILSTLLINKRKYKIFFVSFLIFLTFVNCNFYLKNMINAHENIEWVVKKTFTKNCKNVPVYFNDNTKDNLIPLLNDIVLLYSKNNRPILLMSELVINEYEKSLNMNKNCKIHFFTFHSKNFENNVDYLNKQDLKLKILYAPNVMIKNFSKAGAIALSN